MRAVAVFVPPIVLALVCAYVFATLQKPADFTAFYCAGTVIRDHGDPYRAIPLGTCEHQLANQGVFANRDVVVPAPLPPYALAPFAVLASLPYDGAITVWRLLLVAAIVSTVLALRAVSRLPWLVIALTLVPIDLILNALTGQPVPLVVGAIATGTWALQRGADRLAGALACVTMLEPHIGLPACLSLFAYRPVTRLPLLGGAVIAIVLSLAAVPGSVNVEYVTRVLPQHAASELAWVWQYSLTHALYVLGASDRVALTAGLLSYFVMAILAMILAPRVAAEMNAPGILIALPAAFAILGGSFIHVAQVPSALPAALMLAGRANGRAAYLGATACILLSIAGIQFGVLGFTVIIAVVVAVLARMFFRLPMLAGAIVGVAVLGAGLSVRGLDSEGTIPRIAPVTSSLNATSLAEEPWSRVIRAVDPGPREQRITLLAEAPTWLGLGLLCGAATLLASPRAKHARKTGMRACQ